MQIFDAEDQSQGTFAPQYVTIHVVVLSGKLTDISRLSPESNVFIHLSRKTSVHTLTLDSDKLIPSSANDACSETELK